MSDLYGKTTESLESLNNVSCASKVTCGRQTSEERKTPKDIELGVIGHGSEKDDRMMADESSELMSSQAKVVSNQPRKRFEKVSRGVVLAKKILSDERDNPEKSQRRMQHVNRFSKVRGEQSEIAVLTRESPVKYEYATIPRGTRDNAAKVLFKAGANKIRTKPNLKVSSLDTYGGRSFLASDLKFTDDGTELGVNDVSFFDFSNEAGIRDLPGQLEIQMGVMMGDPDETFTTASIIDTGKKLFKKGGKSQLDQKIRKKKKARFYLSSLLGGKIKRNISEKLRCQSDDQREYFTVWLSFVQVVIMIVVLCIYPFAPLGIDVDVVRRDVLLSRDGVLYTENLERRVVESFWLGPSLESLILLGAKYAPCMRRDTKVYVEIEKERRNENSTGCCMAITDGCIQRQQKDCITPSVEFKPNTVCGQDPQYCSLASKAPASWDPYTIVSWPKCKKKKKVLSSNPARHMTCEVTGRPCCINTQGQCVITTHDNCKFWDGIYHADATLCSQVDCLAATCGNSFTTDDYPDQIYRLLLSLFLCAGILHLVFVLIFNFTILRYIEVYAGWFRTALIFFITGVGGNLWSSILLPYQAEVGESGAMFGIFACVFVEGIQSWNLFERPCHYMGKLVGILIILLLFGLLPYVDNFAHIFGFIYGILVGFIILPHIATKENEEELRKEKTNYMILSVIAFIFVVGLTILGLVMFYYSQDIQSGAIALFNCPLGKKFCQNFHQGQEVENRDIEY